MASISKKELGISDGQEFSVGGRGQLHWTRNLVEGLLVKYPMQHGVSGHQDNDIIKR
jgi:hypothetical protein